MISAIAVVVLCGAVAAFFHMTWVAVSDQSPLDDKKPARNAPCRCGSGKKYKDCCFSKDEEKSAAEDERRMGDELQEKMNPRATSRLDIPPLLDTRNWQQDVRGELRWAALRQEEGEHVPEMPPLASKGPDEIAADYRDEIFKNKKQKKRS